MISYKSQHYIVYCRWNKTSICAIYTNLLIIYTSHDKKIIRCFCSEIRKILAWARAILRCLRGILMCRDLCALCTATLVLRFVWGLSQPHYGCSLEGWFFVGIVIPQGFRGTLKMIMTENDYDRGGWRLNCSNWHVRY